MTISQQDSSATLQFLYSSCKFSRSPTQSLCRSTQQADYMARNADWKIQYILALG